MNHTLASVLITSLLASTIGLSAYSEQPKPYVQTGPTQAHTVENVQFAKSPVSNGSVDHLVNDGAQATTVVTPNQGYVNTSDFVQQNTIQQPTQHTEAGSPQSQGMPQQSREQALSSDDYWMFSTESIKLKTLSNRKYDGYEVKLVNTQPYHLQILSGHVTNALSEQHIAAEAQAKKKNRFGLGKLALGAAGTALSLVPYAGGAVSSTAYAAAAHATNIAHAGVYYGNQLATNADGSLSITGAYVQQFKEVVLGPNQEFRFSVIVPSGQQPHLQMVFKNLETNQILDVNQSI